MPDRGGMKVLVTGASGFVGFSLMQALAKQGIDARGAYRARASIPEDASDFAVVGEVNAATDWRAALDGVSHVIHLVALTHGTAESSQVSEADFERVNVEGTRRLAEQAAAAGVGRFVFMSSIKVNGERTAERAFRPDDEPRPEDAYGRSKLQAERALRSICDRSAMQGVVLRVPLLYGSRARGNFARLVKLARTGWPLPIARIDNRRSLLGIDNCCDALVAALAADNPGADPLLISDGDDVSTPGLIRMLATAAGRRPRLFSLPPGWMASGARLVGLEGAWQKLCGSLQLDSTDSCQRLGWTPPLSLQAGLERALVAAPASGRHRSGITNAADRSA